MNAVDTNVLIYVRDPRDRAKQEKAVELTTSLTDGALPWQVACEFISASRKLAPFGFTQAEAWRELERLRLLWQQVLPTDSVLKRAEQLTAELRFRSGMQRFWRHAEKAASHGSILRILTPHFQGYGRRDRQSVLKPRS